MLGFTPISLFAHLQGHRKPNARPQAKPVAKTITRPAAARPKPAPKNPYAHLNPGPLSAAERAYVQEHCEAQRRQELAAAILKAGRQARGETPIPPKPPATEREAAARRKAKAIVAAYAKARGEQ